MTKTILDFAKRLLLYNYESCHQERCKKSKLATLRDLKKPKCETGDIKDWTSNLWPPVLTQPGPIRKGKEGTLLSFELSSCSGRTRHWPGRCCWGLCPRCWPPDTGRSHTSPRRASRWWAAGRTVASSEAEGGFAAVEEKSHQKTSASQLSHRRNTELVILFQRTTPAKWDGFTMHKAALEPPAQVCIHFFPRPEDIFPATCYFLTCRATIHKESPSYKSTLSLKVHLGCRESQ